VPKYNWAWPALGTVMKEEGFGALYKGGFFMTCDSTSASPTLDPVCAGLVD